MKPFPLGRDVTLRDLVEVSTLGRKVVLPPDAKRRVLAARKALGAATASGGAVYGVNTGFGELASRRIPQDQVRTLQYNLLRSHACGVGEPLAPGEARGILFLRANELARGHSGCRVELAETLARLINAGVTPVIPSRGSVGASGDLAPQAHAALLAIGEGSARIWNGARKSWGPVLDGREALRRAGVRPVVLEAKEGLSLINGTQAMQAVGGLALHRAEAVLEACTAAGAMSLEAIKGTPVPYERAIVELKPHPGQLWAAKTLRSLLHDSEIRESHREGDPRVQDPYSLRCIPQVHGAVRDALAHAAETVRVEMASVTDNPVVVGSRVISGGNFHGQALAFVFDYAAIALCSLASMSERRIAQLVSGVHALPPFLAENPGLESGFMIPQVVAAALASENKGLAHPASVDSIPTSAEKEDFVSMGMGAALKLSKIIEHVSHVVAIEFLAAGKGVEMHAPLKPGTGVAGALGRLRAVAPRLEGDASLHASIEAVSAAVLAGDFRVEECLS
ncbi:MAG: histidine ammonia-lyase [Elusimicrobia bacterium]|nr:histidine ammonia-lyase [Elusimicrobiota bacterium]